MDSLLHNLRTLGIDHDDRTVGVEAADEIERLRAEIARLAPLAKRAESAMPSVRYRIKLNGYGRLLQGHWFWLDPADDHADLALKQHIANERVGLETALAPER